MLEWLETSSLSSYHKDVSEYCPSDSVYIIQAIQTAAIKNSKRRGSSKSEERDKKLTMMVALMVRLLSKVND